MLSKADLGSHGIDVIDILTELLELDLDEFLAQRALDTELATLGVDPAGSEDAQENARAFREGLETAFAIEISTEIRFKTVGDAIRFVNQNADGATS